MKDLLLHKVTRLQANVFAGSPSHALLITGDEGSGKGYLSTHLSTILLGLDHAQDLQSYPYFVHIKRPDGKQDIPIESIRALNKLLTLKAPGSRKIRRVILIEDAHYLNEESSNALLKMLEEPSIETVFILTATSPEVLLPTISSRAQQLQVKPVSLTQSLEFLKDNYVAGDIEKAWRLSGGSAGLMVAILGGDNKHPLKMAVDEAKDYLRKSSYERLLMIDVLSRDKTRLALFLEGLVRVLGAVQRSETGSSSNIQQKNVLRSRRLVLRLQEALDANVSTKLIALNLGLNLI